MSKQEGFCRPKFVNKDEHRIFRIKDGRNIIVDSSISMQPGLQYVPNDIDLDASKTRGLVLTGPNMGGKSCYLRQIGMAALMGQIGCFVAGQEAILPIFDAIYIRIGARDDLWTGRSTLKVELDEACVMLENATENSLVLIDELGRGTSTHDGRAIAKAVLKKLLQKKCFVIFVTHFKSLTLLLEIKTGVLVNGHMNYQVPDRDIEDVDSESDDRKPLRCKVLLLYKLCPGPSESSFGTNVARLAGLPESIVNHATKLAIEAEKNYNRIEEFSKIIQKSKLNLQE